jgi:hypothetical protein
MNSLRGWGGGRGGPAGMGGGIQMGVLSRFPLAITSNLSRKARAREGGKAGGEGNRPQKENELEVKVRSSYIIQVPFSPFIILKNKS